VALSKEFDAGLVEDEREAGGTTKAWVGAKRMRIKVDKNPVECIIG